MMPVPHEKLPTCVPRNGQLLALMQHKFLCVPKFASQVPTLPDPDTFAVDIVSAWRMSSGMAFSRIEVRNRKTSSVVSGFCSAQMKRFVNWTML